MQSFEHIYSRKLMIFMKRTLKKSIWQQRINDPELHKPVIPGLWYFPNMHVKGAFTGKVWTSYDKWLLRYVASKKSFGEDTCFSERTFFDKYRFNYVKILTQCFTSKWFIKNRVTELKKEHILWYVSSKFTVNWSVSCKKSYKHPLKGQVTTKN